MLRRPLLAVLGVLGTVALGVGAEDRYFDSAGVRIHYTVQGKGEPVLLIHGFAANLALQWAIPGTAHKLSEHYEVIAFDNRGHGLSAKPHDSKEYGREMVEDAVRLLDHLGVRRAHVVGYSMGAVIATKLMMTHPERVLTVTLGGAAGLRERSDTRLFDRLATDLEQGRGVGAMIIALTPPGRMPPTEDQLKFVNGLFETFNDPKALAACVRGWRELTVPDRQWRDNHIPTLAIVGGSDPLKANVDEIAEVMADLQVIVIPRADHMVTYNSPQFVRAIERFLSRHPAEAAEPEPADAGR